MSSIEAKLNKLREFLETAAFMVSKGDSEKEAHSLIVNCLVVVSEVQGLLEKPKLPELSPKSDRVEVNKVNRRLRLWARRQDQINSKILNAFLKLKRSGKEKITEIDLKNELPQEQSFESNFAQMKVIADKNHGKVFDQFGDVISLWDPVVPGIDEYEKIVFGIK